METPWRPDATDALRQRAVRAAHLRRKIARLREALIGVSERELPGDPLPCFCVSYPYDDHDEWCDTARAVLAETADVQPASPLSLRPRPGKWTGS